MLVDNAKRADRFFSDPAVPPCEASDGGASWRDCGPGTGLGLNL